MNETKNKSKLRRIPSRGAYDKETIYNILDQEFLCHVGFVYEGYPVVIPTMFGRRDDTIILHGSAVSRMLKTLEEGIPVSICVSRLNGLVLARSAFHHSLNYQSVVLFGTALEIEDPTGKMAALKVVSDQMLPGRWEEARHPTENELKATKVLEVKIEEASSKVRTGPPGDDAPDYELDIWARVVPVRQVFDLPNPDPNLKEGVDLASSLKNLVRDL